MKLNKKGYMLVEIIIASVLAMCIAFFLLNLTYKFQNNNEDIFMSYSYMKDKILITKNIMNDLEKGTLQNVVINENEISFNLFDLEGNSEQRKLMIKKENEKNTIEYGKIESGSFVTTDVSYYKKEFLSTLIIDSLVVNNNNNSNMTIEIPMHSIYDNNDYSIKLYATYH